MSISIAHEKMDEEQRISSLDEVAETIREEALAYALEKVNRSPHGELDEELLGQPTFVEYFKYGIADGIARVLATKDSHVQAAYIYDTSTDADLIEGEELTPTATIQMLLLVDKPSAALQSLITSLDNALIASVREVAQKIFGQAGSMMEIQLVTEEDVRSGRGYAVLIKSVYSPPIQIWSREAGEE